MTGLALEGIIAYPVTPFAPGGEDGVTGRSEGGVDTDALTALVDRLIDAGCHAIAPLGSTGESAYLDDQEWYTAAEAALAAVAGRVPAVVGVADLTTRGAVRRARFAERAGADAVMVLPQAYWKLDEREVAGHFTAVADAVTVPVMLYNNPATSGVDLSPELMVSLVERVENITMVKESSGDVRRMHRLTQLTDGALPFYNGSNPPALAAFSAGAAGWCTAAPCLIPGPVLELHRAVRAGEWDLALEVFQRQLPVLEFILGGGLPTTVKAGLALLGMDVGGPRRPLLPLDPAGTARLAELLAAAG
ncbi:dihydrodipicolinate synthase family protein [Kitasatospora purpeofusca]|uniref:dihydrodipicolinate synthase family protein n=1 Tax=Kitasatospora purpeofusca TaxID=67352 RepID=UPI0022554C3D|nr:dihydrodipicolinate synthase family protein [Kitasatospora purpeofusca]MCX4759380.1 dihydrodipicolinate synthase family protein [Kitasatospora purpeofusca]WSR30228.1 dihydrodipicolinate synthase family protein [Kitasatospora purpeofusca]